MRRRVLLWTSFLFCAGCCSGQAQAIATPKLEFGAISTAENADERAYMSSMYALFQIVDPKYSDRVLEKAPDYSHFQGRVSDWIEKNRDRWNEIKARLDYCRGLMRKGRLGTDIDSADPDIRWRLFMEYGAPQDQLTLRSRFRRADTVCTVWTLLWPSVDSTERGLEVSCWSRSGQDYPTEIIPTDDNNFPIASPIWPFVNYSKFPADDGTVDLWFSIWVPGDQFTRPTLEEGLLKVQIDLYDISKTTLIASGEETSDLQLIRSILKTTKQEDRHLTRAMGYLGFAGVTPGEYNAHLTICGAECNEGEEWIEVSVPMEEKISDLLVLGRSMVTSDNQRCGITRGESTGLYDNPECRLVPKAKLGLYFEAELPKEHGKLYDLWVTLLRMPEVSGRKAVLVTTGRPVVVADSLDCPFTDGEWQSSRNQKVLEEMAESVSDSKSPKTITLLKKKFKAPEEDAVTVNVAPQLNSNLKSGQYLLTVTMSDPERGSYYLSARRVIHVLPNGASGTDLSLAK